MSLFPAYAKDFSEQCDEYRERDTSGAVRLSAPTYEAQLLASDNDDDRESTAEPEPAPARPLPHSDNEQDFYFDNKLDFGNIRVSTIYYPGRPQYECAPARSALGLSAGGTRAGKARRRERYHCAGGAAPPTDHADLAARISAYRDLLANNPHDEQMWIDFIDFQERCVDAEAGLAAAEAAHERLPLGARVRAQLHRLRAALPPLRRLQLLRAELPRATLPAQRAELWLRLVRAAADAGGAELQAAAAAALGATRAVPSAYPHLLYEYGLALREAGHWERLVLLLELVMSMNFPPAGFPPPVDPQRLAAQERTLLDLEEKAIGSGLPLSVVWVRVERARAAAHWRGEAPGGATADPQRAPAPSDVAELLLPAHAAAAPLLLLQALRLAKVPLLPCAGYALSAAAGAPCPLGDAGWAAGGEALLALLRAARRLPPAHPARPSSPQHAAALLKLFVDPPHYFSDDTGYLSWVSALWEGACAWSCGEVRGALLCWRLRWLHALALLADADEARALRRAARAALKRWGGAAPLPFAQFARVEQAAGDAPAARHAALLALRAALRDPALPQHHALYVARVVSEVTGDGHEGTWSVACAALGRSLPPEQQLTAPPPDDLLQAALLRCEQRCRELELQYGAAEHDAAGDAVRALLPAPAEWAAARVLLCPPRRSAQLLALLRAAATQHMHTTEGARYCEQWAAALVVRAAREHRQAHVARALHHMFPHNALIALAHSGAPLWAWEAQCSQQERARALGAASGSHVGALAHVLPALLRAAPHWRPPHADLLLRAAARARRRGAGGALLHAVRLHAEAHATRPQPRAALLAAVDAHPQHKWLAVRGAAQCGEEAPALHDVLLERALRVHALMDELTPTQHS